MLCALKLFQHLSCRGFVVCKKSTLTLEVDKAGSYTYPDPSKKEATEGVVTAKELVAA